MEELLILPTRSCIRCLKTWTPRKLKITQCPKCHSSLWNTPRVYRYKNKKSETQK